MGFISVVTVLTKDPHLQPIKTVTATDGMRFLALAASEFFVNYSETFEFLVGRWLRLWGHFCRDEGTVFALWADPGA